jgi:hypothetical protein
MVAGTQLEHACRSAQACLNVLRAGLIAARVDLCRELFPGVLAAPLVIGTIAGSGGRFSIDAVLAGFGALDGARGAADFPNRILCIWLPLQYFSVPSLTPSSRSCTPC